MFSGVFLDSYVYSQFTALTVTFCANLCLNDLACNSFYFKLVS
jgi:hypothetical protein